MKDVFFSIADGTLAFLLVDTGSWLQSDTVLISSKMISDISIEDRSIELDITAAQLEAAPVWKEDDTIFLDAMPPVVVGPFGNTISPAMMAALIRQRRQEQDSSVAEELIDDLDQFTTIQGTDVFGTDGELGNLVDFLMTPEERKITHMVIDNGNVLPGRQLVIPLEKLRHKAAQDTHLVLDLTSSELADAPQLEAINRVNRNWLDDLRSYYGLPI
ncbi:PRC-barrel domain-containing protein [Cognatishimia sp. MH4019]|uniref:PRC-barrel domain-containing protein n=1 Tax=Cognatishimia sp. MH4019 TaxID=2854030 RepID=UPI001CD4A427|nr:PRC-barrel domain-containing protein [Cognatishimia sp. MH4019]